MAWAEPLTYIAGSMYTAAQANRDLRDNPAYLFGDAAWIVPTYQNAWVNYGAPFTTNGYRRLGDVVYLRGVVKSGTVSAAIFTLPVGYRPTSGILELSILSNSVWGWLRVFTTGVVYQNGGSNAAVCMDGVAFSVT